MSIAGAMSILRPGEYHRQMLTGFGKRLRPEQRTRRNRHISAIAEAPWNQAPRESECSRRAPASSVVPHAPCTPELLEVSRDVLFAGARCYDQFAHLIAGYAQSFEIRLIRLGFRWHVDPDCRPMPRDRDRGF